MRLSNIAWSWSSEINGVAYYNDSKATSVDATLKAMDAFPGGLWIILGGKDKDSDYTVLRDPLRAKAKAALLIGSAAQKIASQITDATKVVQCGTLAAALQQASRAASPGDTVLLAPACASYRPIRKFRAARPGLQRTGPRLGGRSTLMAQRLKSDWLLFSTVVIMVGFGLVMIYSASSVVAELNPRIKSSFHFVSHQLVWADFFLHRADVF